MASIAMPPYFPAFSILSIRWASFRISASAAQYLRKPAQNRPFLHRPLQMSFHNESAQFRRKPRRLPDAPILVSAYTSTIGRHMRSSRALLVALIPTSLLPTPAPDDTKPYFSLSSGKTYSPGDKPAIQMWSQNIDSLEFRVYRVKDPILFFQKLEDVHRLGTGNAPRKAGQITLIERFHQLKTRARNAVRTSFRAQYTPASREAIRNWIAANN